MVMSLVLLTACASVNQNQDLGEVKIFSFDHVAGAVYRYLPSGKQEYFMCTDERAVKRFRVVENDVLERLLQAATRKGK